MRGELGRILLNPRKREEACIWSGCLRGREEGTPISVLVGTHLPTESQLDWDKLLTQFQTATQQREQLYCSLADTSVGYWFPNEARQGKPKKCMTPWSLGAAGGLRWLCGGRR